MEKTTQSGLSNIKKGLKKLNINPPQTQQTKPNSQIDDSHPKQIPTKNVIGDSVSSSSSSNPSNKSQNESKKKEKVHYSLENLEKDRKPIGCGASGEVYRAWDKITKHLFALKVVKYRDESLSNKLIDSEVKIASELKSENTVRCYAIFKYQYAVHFVLEFMDRGTLADLLQKTKNKKIPEHILGNIFVQVLKGLNYIQRQAGPRIIHRDLKPTNILINSKGCVKISDFGISALVEGSWDQRNTVIGTVCYMSPERIRTETYYPNCDVWSLGIIVLECCLGHFPYDIEKNGVHTHFEFLDLLDSAGVPNAEGYSKELNDFIKKCLIKDATKRPKASELFDEPFIQKYINSNKKELQNWFNDLDKNNN